MKRVGNLTLYGNDNYGNKLQNYAVQETLRKENIKSYTLSILKKTTKSKYLNEIIKIQLNKIIKMIKRITKLKKYERYNNFYKFDDLLQKKNVIYSNNKKIDKLFDYIVYGSDQVWNPQFGIEKQNRFGEFIESNKVVAFSASFGVSEIKEDIELYKKGLKHIGAISVREDAGKEIIENLTDRDDVTVLVDPTMLLDKNEWKKVSKKPKKLKEEKFILNYFLGNLSEKRKEQIYNLANKNKWRVINILDKNDPFYTCGPSEFLYLEENAELICTDSFHSSVFGIIFETPFIVFNREDSHHISMNSRIETLLSKFQLEERMYKDFISEELLYCDYNNTKKILDTEKTKAKKFIKEYLN